MPSPRRRTPRRRTPRRAVRCLLAVALLLSVAACRSGDGTSATSTTGRGPLRWVALGDSYSAGFGGSLERVRSATTDCGRAEADSYARRALALLGERKVELTVAACGGAVAADLDRQLAAAGPADVVTVTVGGNDFGFGELIRQCSTGACPDLGADGADLVQVPAAGDGRRDWQVLGDTLTERFTAVLRQIEPGGTLLVLTYPVPFPETPGACPTGAAPVRPADTALINAAVTRLDDTVAAAAGRAGTAVADRRVAVVEWRGPDGTLPAVPWTAPDGSTRSLAWNPAGICGTDPMVNGLRLDGELADSFHPSDHGLDLAAAAVAAAVTPLATAR